MNKTLSNVVKGIAGLALAVALYSCNSCVKPKTDDAEVSRKYAKVHVDSRLGKTGHNDGKTVKYNVLAEQLVFADLLTKKVYDSRFNSIENIDEKIAGELYQVSLEDLVRMGAISSKNPAMKDFWLPLGLKDSRKIDYKKGICDSWDEKINKYKTSKKLSKANLDKLIAERDESSSKMSRDLTKSGLREYRRDEIGNSIKLLHQLTENYLKSHFNGNSDRNGELKRLLLNVEAKLSANVLLGYNIQELLPPSFGDGKINAVAKAYFLNRFLCEGGKEFIERFPARYDPCLSYGPFQLTKFPLADIRQNNLNDYVEAKFKVPTSMSELNSLQDHTNAAAMFAFNNWVSLGRYLAEKNLLKKFNDGFEKMNTKEQQIVLAGITACMHHKPIDTKTDVANYISTKSMSGMHYGLYGSLSKQLDKYYQSAAESYLAMKVFNILDDKYSK